MHVKPLLTVFCVTTGRAPYVPHPMAKSGPERSQVGIGSNDSAISERSILASHRPNRPLRTGEVFTFGADLGKRGLAGGLPTG
jgi:hypothetical protein